MTTYIFIAIILIVFLYIINKSKKKKALERQKQFKKQQIELERKKQIGEAQKQKILKEKREQEQKKLKEQQAELERRKQIEEARQQKALKEREELERKRLEELQAKFEIENKFIIYPNNYLREPATAFYHDNYHSGSNWRTNGTIENMIWTIKNDASPFPDRLPQALRQLERILLTDLQLIRKILNSNNLTVCVVPRAKAEGYYRNNQLMFREIISLAVDKLNGLNNGTKYIIRHTDTRTTHLNRNGNGGNGDLPYPGITKRTCTISEQVNGKDILLIDDLYTRSVNIDEDAIQALLDNGANSVAFYSIGKTVFRNHSIL